ncbi:MAG TPA: protein kinase [Pyrinomonadaceae bacterium]|jgi:serine/threonine protein kinase/Flp pilus assembly protein TadD
MSSERRQKIETIFHTATVFTGSERAEYLDKACAGDAEDLRPEIEELLARFDAENTTAEKELDALQGRVIGAYRLLREIGRGGMGAVYLAERADGIFKTKAAVKLIKRGMDTDSILKRFRNERQILAALNHPNVARLLDGGTTPDGLPYFVMEYIDGKPLFQYCDERDLDLRARLEIFRQICDAVQEAHDIKVVHRDLKPSNILVKADGTPKLLDFGIAKLLDPELASATVEVTMTQWRMMTPQYASPEQVYGGAISFASDIYSLGVLLYELVTGAKPYRFSNSAPHEISRVICEQEPAPISDLGFRIADLNLSDLNKVVLKALRKNPAERYQAADALGEDIGKLLKNRPVAAEIFVSPNAPKASGSEQKHSVAILPFKLLNLGNSEDTGGDEYLSLGLADALVTRLSGMQRLLVRPTSSVMRFGENADAFQAGTELGVEFIVEGNIRRVGERIRVTTQLLDVKGNSTRWADKFDENFTDVLELEDTISERVAKSLLPQLTGEEKKRLDKRGTNNPQAYEAYLRGRFFWNQFVPEAFPKAIESFQKAVALDPEYALAYVGIADFYNWACIYGLFPTVVSIPKVYEAATRALEIDDTLGEAYAALGLYYSSISDFETSDKYYRRAIELNPSYPLAHEWYGSNLTGRGNHEEGIKEVVTAEQLDPFSMRAKTLTAWTAYQAHDYEFALVKAREIIELDPNFPQGYLQVGNILHQLGRFEEGLAMCRKAVELMPGSPLPVYNLCFALVANGNLDEAREFVQKMEEKARENYVGTYFLAMSNLAVGNTDRTFYYLQKAIDEKNHWLLWLGSEPKLDSIRSDPRFEKLYERDRGLMSLKPKLRETKPEAKKSVAVLPFKLTGAAQPDDEFLSVGLTDALIMRISNFRKFHVRPTSVVLAFGDGKTDPFEVGKQLDVEYLLDGTIRRVGDRIRVTAQLLNVQDSSTAWSFPFDEKYTDVLALEDSISEKVAKSILPQFSGDEARILQKRGTNNAEAFEAFMKARFYWNRMTEESFARAIQYYEKAVALDPEYALAYASIAEYYIHIGIQCLRPFAECSLRAKEAAEKAVKYDPSLAEAHAALGFAAVNVNYDWEGSVKHYRDALAIDPDNVTAQFWLGIHYIQTRRYEDAIRQIEKAVEIEPRSVFGWHNLAWDYFNYKRFDDSLRLHQEIKETYPAYVYVSLSYSWALRHVGRFDAAIAEARRGVELVPENPMYLTVLAAALAAAGKTSEALAVLDEITEISRTKYVSPYMMAIVHACFGDRDKAFEALKTAAEIRDSWISWVAVDLQFESLRDDPRFDEILRMTNHPLSRF